MVKHVNEVAHAQPFEIFQKIMTIGHHNPQLWFLQVETDENAKDDKTC